jgi:hypothetical protein
MESREILKSLCRELGIRVDNGVFANNAAERQEICSYLAKQVNQRRPGALRTIGGKPTGWKWLDVAVAIRQLDNF